jgi:hypothetical protein
VDKKNQRIELDKDFYYAMELLMSRGRFLENKIFKVERKFKKLFLLTD